MQSGLQRSCSAPDRAAPAAPIRWSRNYLGGYGLRQWSRSGLNRRPPACHAGALPTELRPQDVLPGARTRPQVPKDIENPAPFKAIARSCHDRHGSTPIDGLLLRWVLSDLAFAIE